MQRICQKCGHTNKNASGTESEGCPSCGAIYNRVEATLAKYGSVRPAHAPRVEPPPTARAPEMDGPTPRSKAPDEKFCADCGALINVKAEICPKCGVRQMPPPAAQTSASTALGHTTPSGRNRTIAALLALFVGGLGIHKFYLGQTGLGIVYLIFFWTFIPALIGLVEAIRLLLMSDVEFAQRYGEK